MAYGVFTAEGCADRVPGELEDGLCPDCADDKQADTDRS